MDQQADHRERRTQETLSTCLKGLDRFRDNGQAIHNLATLFTELGTLTRNTIIFAGGTRITKLAVPTPLQRRAFELIGAPIPIELNAK